jgi:hypothetical protein
VRPEVVDGLADVFDHFIEDVHLRPPFLSPP